MCGTDDPSLLVFDTASFELIHELKGHTGFIRHVSAGETIAASASEDNTTRVWSIESGALLHVLPGVDRFKCKGSYVSTAAISPDEERIFTYCLNHNITVWNARTGEIEHELLPPKSIVVPFIFNSYLTFRNKSGIGHENAPTAAAWSADGNFLATAYQDIIIWRTSDWTEHLRLPGHSYEIRGLSFLEHSRELASCGWDAIRLWDLETGAEIGLEYDSTMEPTSLALTADEKTLLTGQRDGSVKFWNVEKMFKKRAGYNSGPDSRAVKQLFFLPTAKEF